MDLQAFFLLRDNPITGEVARKWASRLTEFFCGPDEQSEGREKGADPFPLLREVVLERAYTLAAYILGDLELARRVAQEVACSLEVPYQISLEPSGPAIFAVFRGRMRNKVKDPAILLDKFVYKKTAKYERRQEDEYMRGERQLDEETMVVRFIKKITEYALDHNTFYMLIGLYRVLYNYSPQEARRLYQLLVECPADRPNPDAMRRRKKNFMEVLERRFKKFVVAEESGGQHERRFVRGECHRQPLVEQTLDLMKPPFPGCSALPERFEHQDEIKRMLQSEASIRDTEDEHLLERNRMHMLAHLVCCSRLLAFLGLKSPEEVLEIPSFNIANYGGGLGVPPLDRRNIPPLTPQEKENMNDELDRRRAAREEAAPERISIMVDDHERGAVSLDEGRPVCVRLEDGDGLIELRSSTEEGGTPLGYQTLEWGDEAARKKETYRMRLSGSREVRLTLTYSRGGGDLHRAVMTCDYATVGASNPLVLLMKRLGAWARRAAAQIIPTPEAGRWVAFGLAGALAIACGVFGTLYLREAVHGHSGRPGGAGLGAPSAAAPANVAPHQDGMSAVNANMQTEAGPTAAAQPPKPPDRTSPGAGKVPGDTRGRGLSDAGLPPLATLSAGISKSVVADGGAAFPRETEVVTLAVSNRRFVKLSELSRGDGATAIDATRLLEARSIYVKPSAHTALSEDARAALVKSLLADKFVLSDAAEADAILEGSVTRNAGGLTLNVLVNDTDGNMIWLKSVKSLNRRPEGATTFSDLSAEVTRSLKYDRGKDLYVALDYYFAQTTSPRTLETGAPAAARPDIPALYARLGGDKALRALIENFVNQSKLDARLGADFNASLPHLGTYLLGVMREAAGLNSGDKAADGKAPAACAKITKEQYGRLMENLSMTLEQMHVGEGDRREVLGVIAEPLKGQLVNEPKPSDTH